MSDDSRRPNVPAFLPTAEVAAEDGRQEQAGEAGDRAQ